jgi:hypothetical protein
MSNTTECRCCVPAGLSGHRTHNANPLAWGLARDMDSIPADLGEHRTRTANLLVENAYRLAYSNPDLEPESIATYCMSKLTHANLREAWQQLGLREEATAKDAAAEPTENLVREMILDILCEIIEFGHETVMLDVARIDYEFDVTQLDHEAYDYPVLGPNPIKVEFLAEAVAEAKRKRQLEAAAAG